MGKRGPYIIGVPHPTRVALQQKKAREDEKTNLNLKVSAEIFQKFSALKTVRNITSENLFTMMLDRWTSTESPVAPQLQMAGPLEERIEEGLQTQKASDMAEPLSNIIKVEPGTATTAREQPELHFPDMKKSLKEQRDTSQRSIDIGNQITRWNEFKDVTQVKTNENAAMILLDRYFGKGLPKETVEERKSSITNHFGEPEYLQMECETVIEDNLYEDTTTDRSECVPITLTKREPENLQMDCETVHENEEINRTKYFTIPSVTRNNGHMSKSSHGVLSIHGLPVNQPFNLKLPKPTMASMVGSKIYVAANQLLPNSVIVKQHLVPNLNGTPVKIVGKGHTRLISLIPNNLIVAKNLKENEINAVDNSHLKQTLNPLIPNNLIVAKNLKEKEINAVDNSHLKQTLKPFETYSDSPQGMPGIGKKPGFFKNAMIKVKRKEDEKHGIVSDIMKDLIDKVVTKGNIKKHGCSNFKRKKTHQTHCISTKKKRLLKYEGNVNHGGPHNTPSGYREYRIYAANVDKLSGQSDVRDQKDILADSHESGDKDNGTTDNKIPVNAESELSDDSLQKNSEVGKKIKEEDPDSGFETFIMTESDKTSLTDTKHNSEKSFSGNFSDSASDSVIDECSAAEKEIYEREKMIFHMFLKRLREDERIKVFLKDHPDKYYTEDQVSAERQFRGLKEAEKTIKLLVCALCKQFRTSNTVRLETHLEHHLNGDWKCKKCKFEGNSAQEYRNHLTENHPSGQRCFVCKTKCGGIRQLREHLTTVHNLQPFLCTRCSTEKSYVMFKERWEYHQHYVENHKDFMFQCTFCGLYFMNRSAQRSHACSGKESQMATCDICGKEMRKISLKDHKRHVHDNVRPFPCKHCSYAGQTRRALKCHILAKHEGVRQVKCDKCDFTCVLKKQLVSHMRTHTGDKPYKCDLCPYAAAWRVQLKEHRQLHGNPIGKECEVCGIVVRMGKAYNIHYKTHN